MFVNLKKKKRVAPKGQSQIQLLERLCRESQVEVVVRGTNEVDCPWPLRFVHSDNG